MDRASVDSREAQAHASGRVVGVLARATIRALTVPIAIILNGCEPIVRILFGTVSVLGILATLVIGGSGSAPHFPFVTALLVFAGCGIVPGLYRALLKGVSTVV